MTERIVRMRASPAGGLGGMYATGMNVHDIVRIAAMVPSLFRQQTVSRTMSTFQRLLVNSFL